MQESPLFEARLSESVTSLAPKRGAGVEVTSVDAAGVSRVDTFDHVISALPSSALASVLASSDLASDTCKSDAITALNGTPRASVAVINLGYRSPVLGKANGFGYLVPSTQVCTSITPSGSCDIACTGICVHDCVAAWLLAM